MGNEHLRAAITAAGLTFEEFADTIQVDVRTVRRWLGGRTPYPRHRAAVASALDTAEALLWPDAVAPPAESPEPEPLTPSLLSDEIAGYPQAKGSAAPTVGELLSSATSAIEIVIANGGDGEGVAQLIQAAAATGVPVWVILGTPVREVEPLLDFDTIEIRAPADNQANILVRVDDEMLLILMSLRSPRDAAPVIHLRRRVEGGLFDRLADDFEDNWQRSTPLTSPEDLDAYLPDGELDGTAARTRGDAVSMDSPPPTPQPPTDPSPRRWPRRRT